MVDLIQPRSQSQQIKFEVTKYLIIILHITTNEIHMLVMPIYDSTKLR